MTLVQLFVLCFVAGPAVYLAFWRWLPVPRFLGAIAALCAGLSVAVNALLPAGAWVSVFSLGVLWVGWICALAAGAQLLAQGLGKPVLGRLAGIVGTTLPWFGFATAQWIAG